MSKSTDKLMILQEMFNYLNEMDGLQAGLNYEIRPPVEPVLGPFGQVSSYGIAGGDQITLNFNFIYTKEFKEQHGIGFFRKYIPRSLLSALVKESGNEWEHYFEFTPRDLDESLSDISNMIELVKSCRFDQEMRELLVKGSKKYLSKFKGKK